MKILARLLERRRRYDDIAVSIEEHIAERADELETEGIGRTEAEQRARREFGGVTQMKERSREAWQWPLVESLFADLRHCMRRMGKSPGFATTVLLTLAIGIGANVAVFSVVNRVLLEPLPYPDSNQIVALRLNAPGGGLGAFSSYLQLSPSMYFTFLRHNKSFESMGIWFSRNANVTGIAQPEEVSTVVVSDGVLQTLDVPSAEGRWFTAAEQAPRSSLTAMLSYGYWQRRFGGDPSVVGRTIQVDGQSREIVGVMPRGFTMVDEEFDIMLPMNLDPQHQKLAPFGYDGVARLKPGVTLAQADSDIARLIPVWMDEWTNGPGTNPHYYEVWRISPAFCALKQQVIGSMGSVLWIVMATVGLVMLIACANIANLLLVRAESRHQELTIRAALGAGSARIARELLVESVLYGLLGGIAAVGVAFVGLKMLVAFGPTDLPRLHEITLDGWSIGFALAVSVLSGLLFGSVPALRYARNKGSMMLGTGNRTASASRERQRARNILVVAQVAMALVLLVSAILMIRTFVALRNVNPGFEDAAHVQTFRVSIPAEVMADARQVMRVENDILDKIKAIPGVTGAGLATSVPMEGFDSNWDEVGVEGKNYEGGEPPIRLFNYVSPGYFAAMGTHIVAGRDFTWTDLYDVRPRVIVSENFARESWGSAAAAIGKRVRQFSSMPWQEVIGVAQNVRQHGVDHDAPAIIYWPSLINNPYTAKPELEAARTARFVVHSRNAGGETLIQQIEQAVWQVDGDLPLASVQTMQQMYAHSMARTSFALVMLAIAGSMALLLSLIGIYGVISYAVSQRTREIGIRLALGAQKNLLRWMFVSSALRLTAVGVLVGAAAAAVLVHLMRGLLFGVRPLDPLTFAVVPLIFAAAAAVASFLPACHAAAVNPVDALKSE